jgi:hypothetical protein
MCVSMYYVCSYVLTLYLQQLALFHPTTASHLEAGTAHWQMQVQHSSCFQPSCSAVKREMRKRKEL